MSRGCSCKTQEVWMITNRTETMSFWTALHLLWVLQGGKGISPLQWGFWPISTSCSCKRSKKQWSRGKYNQGDAQLKINNMTFEKRPVQSAIFRTENPVHKWELGTNRLPSYMVVWPGVCTLHSGDCTLGQYCWPQRTESLCCLWGHLFLKS